MRTDPTGNTRIGLAKADGTLYSTEEILSQMKTLVISLKYSAVIMKKILPNL
jgi:hypothetical protein